MDHAKALAVLSSLANGIDPTTGELFDPHSPYQSAEVIRALYVGVKAIETLGSKSKRSTKAPLNAGQPWTEKEDRELLALFDGGNDLPTIARSHGRTVAGIHARLERHGRLSASGQWRPGTGQQHTAPSASKEESP